MIAVALDAGFDVGGVRRGHRGLGHQEGGADLAVHQRLQPLPLVLLGAVAHQHFHVAGIGRGAVEHFGGPADVAHLLGQRRVFQIGQSRAAEFIVLMRGRRHEHVPEAFGLRLLLQIFEDRDHLPALAGSRPAAGRSAPRAAHACVMNDCTRLSQSFWRSDILKSMGRSSPSFLKIFGRTVCPPPVRRKTISCTRSSRRPWRWRPDAGDGDALDAH